MVDQLIDLAVGYGKEVLGAEVTKMTLAFLIAARLHRGWVKKDISEQVKSVTVAINNVASTCAKALESHSSRLDTLTERVDKLEKNK